MRQLLQASFTLALALTLALTLLSDPNLSDPNPGLTLQTLTLV